MGDPRAHPNEDRAMVVRDLLSKAKSKGKSTGAGGGLVSYLAVFDGHGGSGCSEVLKRKLHEVLAKHVLRSGNTHSKMRAAFLKAFAEADGRLCGSMHDGACATVVALKDRKLYCGNCGVSARLCPPPRRPQCRLALQGIPWRWWCRTTQRGESKRRRVSKRRAQPQAPRAHRPGTPILLNDRHAVYLSPREKARLAECGAEVSQAPGMEDALVARTENGEMYKVGSHCCWPPSALAEPTPKAIYPSRSFGDADFKARTAPVRALIAVPTGRGIDYEGCAATIEHPPQPPL